MNDIGRIERTTYASTCKNSPVNVKFHISELPNDMKMLAFLGGDLRNAGNIIHIKIVSTDTQGLTWDLKSP